MLPRYENPTPHKPIPCGRYHLVERIGYGGMAEVFKAKLPGPNGFSKTVVIKRILPRLLDEKLMVQMFIEEAKIAAAADHDNIAKVFELGQTDDGKYFMAMEFIAGVDLEVLLQGAAQRSLRVPIWFTVKVVADVLEALGFVHDLVDEQGQRRNVIHRDATPSNIFVSYLGQVKLSDFGVADFEGKTPTTKAGQLKGKLAYMSPEQLNAKMLDQRSDLFSLGVVLWEALTQQRLFGQLNEMQAMLAICDDERKPPSVINPDVPPELDAVALKALAADRGERYESAAAFQSDLLDCLHALRPPVRRADMKRIVHVLLGRREPDAETQAKPMSPSQAPNDASFLLKLDASERARLAEARANAMDAELSIPIEEHVDEGNVDSSDLEDTYVHGMKAADIQDAETLDEHADPKVAEEVEALRAMIAAKKAKVGEPMDEEDDSGSEDATITMRATDTVYHFWVKSPGAPASGPHPYLKARELLAEAGMEGTPISISVDQRHWMRLEDFSRLSGQDLVVEMAAPPSNVSLVGTLEQRSLPAVFGLIARDHHTGTLSVVNPATEEWYEIHVRSGHPVDVVTNVESMQLPALLVARDLMPAANVDKLLHGIISSGQPAEEVAAKVPGLATLDRPMFMRARLTELFRWTDAEYTFNLDLKPRPQAPFAESLLSLLPSLIDAALSTEALKQRLGPRLAAGFEASWRFGDALREMELDDADRALADRLKSRTPIQVLCEQAPEQARRILVLAYALAEADLILEALED